MSQLKVIVILLLAISSRSVQAVALPPEGILLQNAGIMVSPRVSESMRETVKSVLQEEIAKRTGIYLKEISRLTQISTPIIVIADASDKQLLGKNVPSIAGAAMVNKPESFRVVTELAEKRAIIWVIGSDARGVLFGSGWLLRQLILTPHRIELPGHLDFSTTPDFTIRGHQLGYRNTANSYDAWTVEQYDQYIRELAIFGANAVEGIPFGHDDSPSPHFKIPAAQMNIRISEICRKYDMDYWVWTPAVFDLTDTQKRNAELEMHEAFYKACPRLDHIFFPGGDPGHNHPRDVLPFLKALHSRLIKYHPAGKIWISLQGFDTEQIDYFYQYIEANQPDWLEGVVSGPGSPPMSETRYRLPKRYKHREYPDITHTVRCEFPMRGLDQAYALTLGRESVNPRPYTMTAVQQTYAGFTDGFVSYSDGNHDDINKVLWTCRAWNQQQSVHSILEEYGRFFFGDKFSEPAASGIEMLEQNWRGPLVQNGGVEATYLYWKGLEKTAGKLNQTSWRWQMLLLRAYYDVYTRRRLLYEQASEQKANQLLLDINANNLTEQVTSVRRELSRVDSNKISKEIRHRIETLCADLFRTTGFQTSVPIYKAKGNERGAVLDFVDYPLNNRWWIADELDRIDTLKQMDEKIKQLHWIAKWENPGPGCFYDDVSSVSKGPRVQTYSDDATDIAWWDNGFSRKRLSAQTFQRSPRLEYDNLDPVGRYTLKVCGYGDALLRVDGIRLYPVFYQKEAGGFKEWIIPASLTRDGKITVSFDEPEESHLNWRQQSRIADVWLLKHEADPIASQ